MSKIRDKNIKFFGEITSLAEPIVWTSGLSNMLEWLVWSTGSVLGVTKTAYRKMMVQWCIEALNSGTPQEELHSVIEAKIKAALEQSERQEKYDKPKTGIASPREVLRRAKYFSEDYLNKEFDIFMALVSDRYLDTFYSQFLMLSGGGEWFTHGNSGIWADSVQLAAMQMDNVSYSPSEKLLVASELKLGGRKNPDQILKYSLMFNHLKKIGFIDSASNFVMLFIGDEHTKIDNKLVVNDEISFCKASKKSTAKLLLDPDVITAAKTAVYRSTTWAELSAFNNDYLQRLNPATQQVEIKLLVGFNKTLSNKAFLNVK